MQLGYGRGVIGQTYAGGPGKFDFYYSKGHRLDYLFIFYVKIRSV